MVNQAIKRFFVWLFMASITALMAPTFAATTTTSLTSNPNPSIPWASVTFTATVTGNAPTGIVTFTDGANTLGSGSLSGSGDSRTASIASGALDAGVHSITAVYAGDALNSSSTSPTLSQSVGAATVTTTTTGLVSNPNPSIPWASVTFTATVTGNAPSGTVTFMDGANTLGSGTLSGTGNSRTVSIVSGALDTGVHSITAVYAGDAQNSTSTSPALSQSVGAATVTTTTTALASNPNPSIPWSSVTFTATVTGNAPSGTVTFKDGVNSLGSGTLSGTGNSRTVSIVSGALDTGVHSITAVYAGDSLNSSSTSPALSQNVGAATVTATTTSLASNPNPSIPWASVTFTATVTGNAPSGTVTFKDGVNSLGSGPLSGTGNSRTVSIVSGALDTGVHSITAVYAGDSLNSTSTSPALSQSVGAAGSPASTTTALVSSANPSSFGQSVTLTATIAGSAPTGTVTFKDGAATLGTGTVSAGAATLAINSLITGSHSLTAVYAGDAGNATSTSAAVAQVVNQSVSTTTLASSANPASFSQNVTLTATVAGQSPTGTVTFMEGATTLGTGTVTAGIANFSTSALALGSHNITATYGGDTNNTNSTSSAVIQAVNQAASSITLASGVNPSTLGQSVTLSATVTGSAPTGAVTFKDGTSVLGTGTITAGVATLATAALSTGPHNLTAVYAGDANNAGSTSNALAQTVNVVTSITTLAASANPSTFGTSITLTATIGGATPSGTVTFMDAASVLGTGTITAGVATLATSTLTTGSHTLTAVYGGDGNNADSTSAVLAQTVNAAIVNTGTSLQANPNPAGAGQSVTLTATITGNNPSGSVSFMEGSTLLGSGTVSAGVATFSTATLTAGSHNLTAVYGGDAGNLASTSAAVSVSINAAGPGAMTWKYGYDAMGRLTSTIDPNGLTAYTYYDSLGRPIQTQQPANVGTASPTITQFDYDLADSLTAVTDPRSLGTSYAPNGLGKVTAQTSPDSGASQYTYDAKGNVLSSTDARGKTRQYAYDALDRLISVSYPTGVATVLEYDGGATPTPAAKGELTKIMDESGSASYTYDALGRMTGKTQATNGKSFTLSYTWGDTGSALDKLIGITYPSGSRVNYSYDAQGAVSGVSVNPVNASGVGVSGTTLNLLSTISYNADSNITGWSWSDGKARSIAYDSFGLISGYSLGDPAGTGASAGELRTLVRDAAGRITGYTHTNNAVAQPSLDQTFGYDNLNRLLSATLASSSTQYSYDANGNRTAKTVGGTSYANTIAATSNRLVQTQDVGGTAIVQHDSAGNIINDGTNSFTYSDRGRMSSATNAGGTVNYLYNALELRVAKSGPGTVVPTGAAYYVYNEAGQLLGEYDANQTPIYETVYLGQTPVGVMKQTGTASGNNIAVTLYNLHADHLATARIVTRQTDQAIVWRWDTAEAFGATAADQNPSGLGTFVYNQRFPGQVFDAETGLNQNWNREYDPRQGRYRQTDPIGLRGGINTFAYTDGNPLVQTDPSGLVWIYQQGTGNLYHQPTNPSSANLVGTGYSGHGVGVNNPALDGISNVGPVPQGTYTIGPQQTITTSDGKVLPGAMRLFPDAGNWMFGRGGFIIHGGDMRTRTSSKGCVIETPNIRNQIGNSGDRTLRVIP